MSSLAVYKQLDLYVFIRKWQLIEVSWTIAPAIILIDIGVPSLTIFWLSKNGDCLATFLRLTSLPTGLEVPGSISIKGLVME